MADSEPLARALAQWHDNAPNPEPFVEKYRPLAAYLTEVHGFTQPGATPEVDSDGDELVKVKRTDLSCAVADLTDAGKEGHALYRLRNALRGMTPHAHW